MSFYFHPLQVFLQFNAYKTALLAIATAFVVTMICIPLVIKLVNRFGLMDQPNARKLHSLPVPTMGGIAIVAGMLVSLIIWMPHSGEASQICFYFGVVTLMGLGMMDDINDLSARYKLVVQTTLAIMMAVAGIRITSFQGLFGINEVPVMWQYVITTISIVGITNAFNLIDGIDGLAGGLGFMSLVMLGIFLIFSNDSGTAVAAFALAGAIFGFLYFNFNPARIFMGDTGSLVLGFVIAVLSIRLLQVNVAMEIPVLHQGPVFILAIAFIPVADTLRVFAGRIGKGKSPFNADKTHIHHLLTNHGYSHALTTRVICILHAIILMGAFWLKALRQELVLAMLVMFMIAATNLFRKHRFF